jgi:hypothetical protein
MSRSTGSVVAAAVLVTSLASFGCKPDASTPPSSAQPPSIATTQATTTATPLPTTPTAPATTPLARGDVAPAFSLAGSDGKTHALADDAGKNVVVVAWFPKAFTGG